MVSKSSRRGAGRSASQQAPKAARAGSEAKRAGKAGTAKPLEQNNKPVKSAAPAKASTAPAPTPTSRAKRTANGAIRVGIAGCAGRMGQMLLKLLIAAPGVLVVGGT